MCDSEIELIWQSDSAIAVTKPAGLLTQAPAGIESLESRLTRQLDRTNGYMAFPHRLDRGVSGVVLVAMTKKAARLLSAQFASRKTQKRYVAMVQGELSLSDLPRQWDDWIRKVTGCARAEICLETDVDAKSARTMVESVKYDAIGDQTRVELRPITGRMHQLRLQTASRGYPIVGDHEYVEPVAGVDQVDAEAPLTEGRILLHAFELGFFDPKSGKSMLVKSPCPF